MCITDQRSLRNPRQAYTILNYILWQALILPGAQLHVNARLRGLENLSKTIPPIDSDQRVALLHAPFKGTTLFGGELARLYRANKKPASSVTRVEIGVDPPLCPQLINRPNLETVKPP